MLRQIATRMIRKRRGGTINSGRFGVDLVREHADERGGDDDAELAVKPLTARGPNAGRAVGFPAWLGSSWALEGRVAGCAKRGLQPPSNRHPGMHGQHVVPVRHFYGPRSRSIDSISASICPISSRIMPCFRLNFWACFSTILTALSKGMDRRSITAMSEPRRSPKKDHKQLVDLIHKGKLFALQEWIKAGKPLRPPKSFPRARRLLLTAVRTGFHSLVEVLLRVGPWPARELADALKWTRSERRYDIADLLLSHGAEPEKQSFETVCELLDFAMIERHLRAGRDPNEGNVFARLLSSAGNEQDSGCCGAGSPGTGGGDREGTRN